MMPLDNVYGQSKIITAIAVILVAILIRHEVNFYLDSLNDEEETKAGVYTEDKLSQFDGIKENKLYLAVLGTVFDVTKGNRHYKEGGAYHYFVGKDGSRALITGNFKDESKERDHVMDLACNDLFALLHWKNTFKDKYTEIGVLSGRYYDHNGDLTPYAKEFQHKIKQCEVEKENSRQAELKYPPCNIAWSEEDGTKVWCTKSSGGIKRNWTGVPRQLFTPGQEKAQCVCINMDEQEETPALIKEYSNCPNTSTTCRLDT